MISFIVCSISKQRSEELTQNIRNTIGKEVMYEVIVFDNTNTNYGISKVYNQCAEKTQYPYLCFLHEDVIFTTPNWGSKIINKLQEPTCGIIGFTGAPIKFKSISSVHPSAKLMINHYIQHTPNGNKLFMNTFTKQVKYAPCITIDGMCMFVKRSIWERFHFDEHLLTGFHGYDLDFSLQVAQTFQNYICGEITIEHFSCGSFSTEWVTTTIRLHKEKWHHHLPLYIEGIKPEEVLAGEEDAFYRFIKKALRTNYPYQEVYKYVKEYWKLTHFRKHSFTLLLKLICIRLLHLKG